MLLSIERGKTKLIVLLNNDVRRVKIIYKDLLQLSLMYFFSEAETDETNWTEVAESILRR
jgi:hypothetical protein